jgi:hypothetical protein
VIAGVDVRQRTTEDRAMTESRTDSWQRKDAWFGVLFLVTGALATVYAVLAARNDLPIRVWGAGALMGPLLLLLGGNATFRALRAKR